MRTGQLFSGDQQRTRWSARWSAGARWRDRRAGALSLSAPEARRAHARPRSGTCNPPAVCSGLESVRAQSPCRVAHLPVITFRDHEDRAIERLPDRRLRPRSELLGISSAAVQQFGDLGRGRRRGTGTSKYGLAGRASVLLVRIVRNPAAEVDLPLLTVVREKRRQHIDKKVVPLIVSRVIRDREVADHQQRMTVAALGVRVEQQPKVGSRVPQLLCREAFLRSVEETAVLGAEAIDAAPERHERGTEVPAPSVHRFRWLDTFGVLGQRLAESPRLGFQFRRHCYPNWSRHFSQCGVQIGETFVKKHLDMLIPQAVRTYEKVSASTAISQRVQVLRRVVSDPVVPGVMHADRHGGASRDLVQSLDDRCGQRGVVNAGDGSGVHAVGPSVGGQDLNLASVGMLRVNRHRQTFLPTPRSRVNFASVRGEMQRRWRRYVPTLHANEVLAVTQAQSRAPCLHASIPHSAPPPASPETPPINPPSPAAAANQCHDRPNPPPTRPPHRSDVRSQLRGTRPSARCPPNLPLTAAVTPKTRGAGPAGTTNAAAASRSGHAHRRERPSSKNATAISPNPSINCSATARCHPREVGGSWNPVVDIRP
ncbi:hypothetical protein Actkin_03167 [Actinokineospora sp. UTMC 2448]|nr:hypothetical protein Actkin_03167 [Actinokineospora sp. UTMC 2448]